MAGPGLAATLAGAGAGACWFLYNWSHLQTARQVFFAMLVQFAASLAIWTMSVPMIRDFAPSTELLYSVLLPAR